MMALGQDIPGPLAEPIRYLGAETGLPYIAASADISSPEAMLDAPGPPSPARTAKLDVIAVQAAAYQDCGVAARAPTHLSRREVQGLKWPAVGRTDHEVAQIISIAMPTVRFHIRNAARKRKVSGRSQAIHRAAMVGYIGAVPQASVHTI